MNFQAGNPYTFIEEVNSQKLTGRVFDSESRAIESLYNLSKKININQNLHDRQCMEQNLGDQFMIGSLANEAMVKELSADLYTCYDVK